MAYTTGDVISNADYNDFAQKTDTVWGVGSGTDGYGQTNTIGTVTGGNTITATQWATLLARITSAANHQGTSITAITSPTVGDTISAYAALATNVSAIQETNNAAASGSDATESTTTTSAWTATATTTKTVSFASYNQLRYFFNAGGMIRMGLSRTGGTASDQNTSWTNLLDQAGTIVLTGSGNPGLK